MGAVKKRQFVDQFAVSDSGLQLNARGDAAPEPADRARLTESAVRPRNEKARHAARFSASAQPGTRKPGLCGGGCSLTITRLRGRIPANREISGYFASLDAIVGAEKQEREARRGVWLQRRRNPAVRNREANRKGTGSEQGREQVITTADSVFHLTGWTTSPKSRMRCAATTRSDIGANG